MAYSTGLLKERQRKHWNSVAPGWGAWLEWTRRNFQPLTEWFRSRTGWRTGARILDVACGAGYPALDAAASVAPGGHVVAIDLSPDMLAAASANAAHLHLGNIEWMEMDAEGLRLGDGMFDVVTNACGLMFCPNPAQALIEAHRVLDSHGRIGIVVWDEPARNPFLTLIRRAAPDILAVPDPPIDEPHPFRLSSPDALGSMLTDAGFSDVRIESVPMTLECNSPADYCRMFADLALKSRITGLPPADAARLHDAVASALQPYTFEGRVRLLATSLCASASKS
jgi:SAM-dependent methyltransferase